jgi:hypothetical protein
MSTIVDLATAKQFLQISHTAQDSVVQILIDGAESFLATHLEIAFGSASVTENLDGGAFLLPKATPITALSSATPNTPTGNTTNGSKSLSNLSSVVGLLVGDAVSGTGIPASTRVVSVGTTEVTLSSAATSSNMGATYTFTHVPTVRDLLTGEDLKVALIGDSRIARADENGVPILMLDYFQQSWDYNFPHWTRFADGVCRYQVTFTAGYAANVCPPLLKQAILMLVSRAYSGRSGESSVGAAGASLSFGPLVNSDILRMIACFSRRRVVRT